LSIGRLEGTYPSAILAYPQQERKGGKLSAIRKTIPAVDRTYDPGPGTLPSCLQVLRVTRVSEILENADQANENKRVHSVMPHQDAAQLLDICQSKTGDSHFLYVPCTLSVAFLSAAA
jgi:hypothetical protein